MKTAFGYIAALTVLFFTTLSCEKPSDMSYNVPEGVLRLFADKTSVAADGADCITFKVMFGSTDVSSEKTMHIEWESEDGVNGVIAPGASSFSTTAPGTYRFKAYLYLSGDHWSDNEIVVNASEVEGLRSYVHRILGEQFTSVGCTSCPSLSSAIEAVQENMPGVLVPVSFHRDFNMYDPMSVPATELFYTAYGFSGLPFFNLNLRRRSGGIGTTESEIMEGIEQELTAYPTICGVAIETAYDSSSRELCIKPKIISNAAVRFKYHIFLVEDGIEATQMGVNGVYVHNNVVRKMFAQDITGLNINGKQPFIPGVEVIAQNSTRLEPDWDPDNMRVVVAAMITSDSGLTFTCSNVNECRIGSNADYLLDE